MFLTVNMVCTNFVNRFLTLIVNGIFGSSHSRVLLKIVILFYIYFGNSRGGVHFQQSCRYYVCRLGGGGLLHGCFSSTAIYCVNCCFLGNCPQWLVHNFKYTFHFNLHGRKALWRALLAGGFLINIWYCISFLLNINSALVIYRAFLDR